MSSLVRDAVNRVRFIHCHSTFPLVLLDTWYGPRLIEDSVASNKTVGGARKIAMKVKSAKAFQVSSAFLISPIVVLHSKAGAAR